MVAQTLLEYVADIVTAHAKKNPLSSSDLPIAIRSVYNALEALGKEPVVVGDDRLPAVSLRSSVKADAIACLDCGRKMKVLKRHLAKDHGLTPDEYRARWSLSSDYPLVAPEYAAKRAEIALKTGLGRNK